jgi:hypothetical protein
MVLRVLFAEFLRLSLLDCYSPLRALTEASAKSIAIFIPDKTRLAINNLERALGTFGNTCAAAVAFLFIYLDYLSQDFCRHFTLLNLQLSSFAKLRETTQLTARNLDIQPVCGIADLLRADLEFLCYLERHSTWKLTVDQRGAHFLF